MKSGKKAATALLAGSLLAAAMFPAAVMGAEAGSAVEITLKSGSPSISINGVSSAIVAPYEQSGTTMVPLRVITESFKADLTYDKGVIGLTYGDRQIVLTIGSKKVLINGKATQVAVAPALINNGTTYVPLRVIAEAFGADVKFDPATKTVTIKGSAQAETGAAAEQAQIGSSYDGWTINDPSIYGLKQRFVNGTYTTFMSTDGSSTLIIDSVLVGGTLSSNEIKEAVTGWFEDGEEVLSERTVTVNGVNFVQIQTEIDGSVVEYRAAQQGDLLYYVIAVTEGADTSDLAHLTELLDSFRIDYDASAASDVVGSTSLNKLKNGISITTPQYWYSAAGTEGFEDFTEFYFFHGGSFSIRVLEPSELTEDDGELEDEFEEEPSIEAWEEKIGGKDAIAFKEVSEEDNGVYYTYLTDYNDNLVAITFFIENGARAEANLRDAQAAVRSMTFGS